MEDQRHVPVYPAKNWKTSVAREVSLTEDLVRFLDEEQPLDTAPEQALRKRVLGRLLTLLQEWVREEWIRSGMPEEDLPSEEEGNGTIWVSGSYRIGVNDRGGDIDTICVVPQHIRKEMFFDLFQAKLRATPGIEIERVIPGARVPLMEIKVEGVDIDLLLATLAMRTVPRNLPIDAPGSARVLRNLDSTTVRTVTGPRDTERIISLMQKNADFDQFKICLRTVRLWAKRRGIWKNKMGYLGGINCAIMCAFVCQMYPKKSASTILWTFFRLFHNWQWGDPRLQLGGAPVELCRDPVPEGMADTHEEWDVTNHFNSRDLMPIITPCYPKFNSLSSVNAASLQIIRSEIARAEAMMKDIISTGKVQWTELFKKKCFPALFRDFLIIDISGRDCTDEDGTVTTAVENLKAWQGWIEAQLRKLVVTLSKLPLSTVYFWPKAFEEPAAAGATEMRLVYAIGLEVNKAALHGRQLQLETRLEQWETSVKDPSKNLYYPGRHSVAFRACKRPGLPNCVIDAFGGIADVKAAVLARRRQRKKLKEEAAAAQKLRDAQRETAAKLGEWWGVNMARALHVSPADVTAFVLVEDERPDSSQDVEDKKETAEVLKRAVGGKSGSTEYNMLLSMIVRMADSLPNDIVTLKLYGGPDGEFLRRMKTAVAEARGRTAAKDNAARMILDGTSVTTPAVGALAASAKRKREVEAWPLGFTVLEHPDSAPSATALVRNLAAAARASSTALVASGDTVDDVFDLLWRDDCVPAMAVSNNPYPMKKRMRSSSFDIYGAGASGPAPMLTKALR